RVVRQALRGDLTEDGMATAMVGRELEDFYPPKGNPAPEAALSASGLAVPGRVHDVSLQLRKGEVLGVAGLVGSARTERAEGRGGVRSSTREIRVNGKPVRINSLGDAFSAGLAYLTEDRKEAGLLLDKGLRVNLALATLEKFGTWRIDSRAEDRALERATQ